MTLARDIATLQVSNIKLVYPRRLVKILTSGQIHQIEQDCAKIGLPPRMLMEKVGKAVAEEVKKILGTIDKQRILILIGPGDNGGDGLVVARYLHDQGAEVSLFLLDQRPAADLNLGLVQERGITCIDATQAESLDKLDELLSLADAVIDALFGTGPIRPLRGILVQALDKVGRARKKRPSLRIIALDLPSGLNADTGAVDPACLYADNTITLAFAKPGLFNSPGAERAGKVTVVDIGIPAFLAEQVTKELITDEWARSALPERRLKAYEESLGKVLVVAGSINYIGGAYLASSGALRVGAGLVTLAVATSLRSTLASKLTEVTYLPLPESHPGIVSPDAATLISRELNHYDVLLLGCGLGQSQSAMKFIKSTLFRLKPPRLVLDGDAVNILTKMPNWWQHLSDDTILILNPSEMGRLAGVSVDEVRSDRGGITKKVAQEWHKTVVLSGAYTAIASPDGQSRISPIANAGLASAGASDVLTGAIAGLLRQGLSPFEAAALGVYFHSKAGEIVKDKLGDMGMVAADLLPALPLAIKQLKEILP